MKPPYIATAGLLLLMQACQLTSADKTTRIVKPSFPGLVFKGEPAISLPPGNGTYTDAGATSVDSVLNTKTDIAPLSVNVKLDKAGFYSVPFEAKNSYGYRTNNNRLVLVTSVSAADDISGTYKRTSNGQLVTVTKKGTGLYLIDNAGGVINSPGFTISLYMGLTDEATLEIPEQASPLVGNISASDAKLVRDGQKVTFSYIVRNTNFGIGVRTFVKQ